MVYPKAPKFDPVPKLREMWGDTYVDEYSWIRGAENIEQICAAENAYTDSVLGHTQNLQEAIFSEIKSRVKETDLSVPIRKGEWLYYSRTVEGLSYGIHCRKSVSDGTEQVLLNENLLASGKSYFSLNAFSISPNGRWLVWGWDLEGNEKTELFLRDLGDGSDRPLEVVEAAGSVAWAADSEHFFYTVYNEMNRPWQVKRATVASPAVAEAVFSEPDDRFYVGVGLEKDRSYIVIHSGSKTTDECYVRDAHNPVGDFESVRPRQAGVEYAIVHGSGGWLILHNRDGRENFSVGTLGDDHLGADLWPDLVAHDPDVMLTGIETIAGFLMVSERAGGFTRVRLINLDSGTEVLIPQPEQASTIYLGANPEFESNKVRYVYTSLTAPASVRQYDLGSGEIEVLKETEVLGEFNQSDYKSKLIWADSDGVQVPVSVVSRVDTTGPAPTLIYAYGAYEIPLDPWFSVARLSLLDRGIVFAIAHVRGGGEMGRSWYTDGKLGNKPNTFKDLLAAKAALIDVHITDSSKVAIRGGSAGGLTVGATLNLDPQGFAAVVAEVPFVDVVNTMCDESLPLTITETQEWGDPVADEEAYRTMVSYSPIENTQKGEYPPMYISTGLSDPWVGYWEPLKWAQVLRKANVANNPIVVHVETEAGHGGPSGRYDGWRDEARVLAFVIDTIGH